MKTIIKLFDLFNRCLDTDHRKRGLACIVCICIWITILFFGVFYTVNNFIDKPTTLEGRFERSK